MTAIEVKNYCVAKILFINEGAGGTIKLVQRIFEELGTCSYFKK